MDYEVVRELIDIAKNSGVSELEVEQEGLRVRVRMDAQEAGHVVDFGALNPAPSAALHDSAVDEGLIAVRSPMVGTYYSAPSPGAEPFVRVGDVIEAGQTLCIVEAMKLMNEIVAEEPGTIREVCCSDGAPVEFDSPLFFVEPLAMANGA